METLGGHSFNMHTRYSSGVLEQRNNTLFEQIEMNFNCTDRSEQNSNQSGLLQV